MSSFLSNSKRLIFISVIFFNFYWTSSIFAKHIEIDSIVVSKNCVETQSFETRAAALENPDCPLAGQEQLIQVSVLNHGKTPEEVSVVLEIFLDDESVHTYQEKALVTPSRGYKMLYSYQIPEKGGQYRVTAKILNLESEELARSMAGVEREFYILRQSELENMEKDEEEKRLQEAKRTAQELEFVPPDLHWSKVSVTPKHVLRGEKFKIRLDLVNTGGDIARAIKAQVAYYNVRLPRRKETISKPKTAVVFPGETITFEIEFIFPDNELLGEYQILAIVDPDNLIRENLEDNNQTASEVMRLSDIKILSPVDGAELEETGLFIFRWDSLLFREFKVQIGIDDQFTDSSKFFDLPQGDRWILDTELSPLSGEFPTLAIGLMKTYDKSTVFWRVIGRKQDGTQSFSNVQTFSILAN